MYEIVLLLRLFSYRDSDLMYELSIFAKISAVSTSEAEIELIILNIKTWLTGLEAYLCDYLINFPSL